MSDYGKSSSIGSGGREHALVWKLRQSPRVAKIYCAPGNGGIADEAECIAVDVKNLDSMIALRESDPARSHNRGTGIAADARIGRRIHAARLGAHLAQRKPPRGSRPARALPRNSCNATEFLRHTMRSAILRNRFTMRCLTSHAPIVVKADGLAAGKGVVIAKTKGRGPRPSPMKCSAEGCSVEAGSRLVLEEFFARRTNSSFLS